MSFLGLKGRARKDFNRKLRKQGQKLRVKQYGSRHKARAVSKRNPGF